MIRKHTKKLAAARHSRWTQKLKIDGALLSINRRSVARAVFFGVFFALLPMPFQFAMVIAVSLFLKFNLPIAFALIWLTNPITMPFILYIEYQISAFILGTGGIPASNSRSNGCRRTLTRFSSPSFSVHC